MLENLNGGRVPGDLVPVDGFTILRSSTLVVAAMGLSYLVGDGQTGSILLVSMRATIQLLVLGQILVPIFQYGHEHWWTPVLYILAMSLIAVQAALGRPKYVYPHIALHFTAGLGTIPLLVAVFVVGPVLRVDPLWEPQYCIPLAGMILNNAISGISLGINSMVTQLKEGSAQVEMLVAMGASRWEACRSLVRTACVVANFPTMNTLSVVGVVSIPGMMTGQIIGGSSPQDAARYQLIVMFMILSANAFAVFTTAYLALCALVSPDGMLHAHKITAAAASPPLASRVKAAAMRAVASCCNCCGGSRRAGRRRGDTEIREPLAQSL